MAHSFLPLSWLLVTKVGLTRAEKMPEPKAELKSRARSLALKTEARKVRRLIEHLAITEEPDTSSSESSSPNGQPPSAHGQAPSADWQAPSSSAQPKQLPDERKGEKNRRSNAVSSAKRGRGSKTMFRKRRRTIPRSRSMRRRPPHGTPYGFDGILDRGIQI